MPPAYLDRTTCSCGKEFYRFTESEVHAHCCGCGDDIDWVERAKSEYAGDVDPGTPDTEQTTL